MAKIKNRYQPIIKRDIFVRKLYKFLREKPNIVEFRKMRGYRGWCFSNIEKIEVDYRQNVLSTLIHEVIHFYYPNWSETEVLWHESYYINAISVRQVKNILKRFAAIL